MSRSTLKSLFAKYDRLWCHIVETGSAGTRLFLDLESLRSLGDIRVHR